MKKIAVVMGSDSDLEVVRKGLDVLSDFGAEYTVHICSAHRTPDLAAELAKSAEGKGYGVIIAAAGMAAHLAGALAANTTLPVIGIPVKSSALEGLDAMLSTVQMPPGIPVACVGINASANAAILAMEILALSDKVLADKLKSYRQKERDKVIEKDRVWRSRDER